MPVPMIAGNWKMNTTIEEAVKLAKGIVESLDLIRGIEKVSALPSFPWCI